MVTVQDNRKGKKLDFDLLIRLRRKRKLALAAHRRGRVWFRDYKRQQDLAEDDGDTRDTERSGLATH